MKTYIRLSYKSEISNYLIEYTNQTTFQDVLQYLGIPINSTIYWNNIQIPKLIPLIKLYIPNGSLFNVKDNKNPFFENDQTSETILLENIGHFNKKLFNPHPILYPDCPVLKIGNIPTMKEVEKQSLPLLSLIGPLLLGLVMYQINPNPMSLIYFAFSPIMMSFSYLQNILVNRKKKRVAKITFNKGLSKFESGLQLKVNQYKQYLEFCSPSVKSTIKKLENNYFWDATPKSKNFLDINLGLIDIKNIFEFEAINENEADNDALNLLNNVKSKYDLVKDFPNIVNLKECKNLTICGTENIEILNSIIVQTVARISNIYLEIYIISNNSQIDELNFLKFLPHFKYICSQLNQTEVITKTIIAVEKSNKYSIVIVDVDNMLASNLSNIINFASKAKNSSFVFLTRSKNNIPPISNGYINTDQMIFTNITENKEYTFKSLEKANTKETIFVATNLSRSIDTSSFEELESMLPSLSVMKSLYPSIIPKEISNSQKLGGYIGTGVEGKLFVDFKQMGPHCLIGGTTGSGKSELLKSIILGLAVNFNPNNLQFILVDYKGGSAFLECNFLPHTVGLLTDLDAHLTNRVLVSLRAELKYRETILLENNSKDIESFGKLPYLFIIIDEFATLSKECPEFIDGIIDIAARGRSLGVHLILATQRPGGVISDNIKANTNLRISLRVSDEKESMDIIGSNDAFKIPNSLSGRAYLKSGSNSPLSFQSSYLGVASYSEEHTNSLSIQNYNFFNNEKVVDKRQATKNSLSITDGKYIVDKLKSFYPDLKLRKPWLNPLPTFILNNKSAIEKLGIDKLKTYLEEGSVILGIQDNPSKQTRSLITVNFKETQNLLLFGSSGSGKTNAIFEILSQLRNPIYYVSSSSYTEPLSNGINIENTEKILRLFQELEDCPTKGNTKSFESYSNLKYLVLDDFDDFFSYYDKNYKYSILDKLTSILLRSQKLGIRVILSCSSWSSISSKIRSSISNTIYFRANNDSEINLFGLSSEESLILKTFSSPGRCIYNGLESQIFINDTLKIETREIEVCPEKTKYPINYKTLEKEDIKFDNILIITGAQKSGKSELIRNLFNEKIVYINSRNIDELITKDFSDQYLNKPLYSYTKKKDEKIIIVIENLERFDQNEFDNLFVNLIEKANKTNNLNVIFETTSSSSISLWMTSQKLRNVQTCIFLGFDEKSTSPFLVDAIPNYYYKKARKRGWFFSEGNFKLIQFP